MGGSSENLNKQAWEYHAKPAEEIVIGLQSVPKIQVMEVFDPISIPVAEAANSPLSLRYTL